MKRFAFVLLGTITTLFSLASCEGGGGVPAARPSATVSGNAVDALIVNGNVAVYSWENGVRGSQLGSGRTDEAGAYLVTLSAPDQPILVEITNGSYTEESTGVSVALGDGDKLRAITHYVSGQPVTVMVTPFTHIAAALAEYKVSHGSNPGNAITEAFTAVSNITGVDILATYPRNVTDPANATATLTDEHRYGFIPAGISSLTKFISEQNAVQPHTIYTSLAFARLMADDVAADGLLDGVGVDSNGNTVSLALGLFAIDANTYRRGIAEKILSMAASTRNKTALKVSDLLAYAEAVASSTHPVYGALAPVPLDTTPPIITNVEALNLWHAGVFTFHVAVSDFIGVSRVSFDVDGQAVGDAANPANPYVQIDTAQYLDGSHVIGVTATDALDNSQRVEFPIRFNNSAPTINVTSAPVTKSATFTVRGTYQSFGEGAGQIYIQNRLANLNGDGTWFVEVALAAGPNVLGITATDAEGNTLNDQTIVSLDQSIPTMSVVYSDANYWTGSSTYVDSLSFADSGTYPIYLTTDKVALNGIPSNSSSALNDAGIPFWTLTVYDPPFTGVYTQPADLKVELQYRMGGTIVADWHQLPVMSQTGDVYLVSLSEEILSPSWHFASPTASHEVLIRVTDEAGNVSNRTFRFKSVVQMPAAAAVAEVTDIPGTFSVTFANRASLDGATVPVNSYTFTNTTSYPVFMYFQDVGPHTATRTYDTAQRFNNVRLVTSPQVSAVVPYNMQSMTAPNATASVLNPLIYNCTAASSVQNMGYGPVGANCSVMNVTTSYEPYAAVSQDTATMTPPTSTSWADCASGDTDHPSWTTNTGVHTVDYLIDIPWFQANVANAQTIMPPWGTHPYSATGSCRKRTVYAYESEPGYPRNETTTIVDSGLIGDISWAVADISGNVVNGVGGFYKVMPGATITATKLMTLPAFIYYTDADVADMSTFSSYTLRKLDNTLSWVIGRPAEISFYHSDAPANFASLYPRVVIAGSGTATYLVAR